MGPAVPQGVWHSFGTLASQTLDRGAAVGSDVSVGATYTYEWITPVGLVPGMSSTMTFTKTVVMRMEVPAPHDKTCG